MGECQGQETVRTWAQQKGEEAHWLGLYDLEVDPWVVLGTEGLPGRRPMAPMAVDMSVFRCIPGGVTTHFPLSRSSAYSGGSSIPRALAMYSGQVSMEERCGLFPPLLSPWQITEPPSLYHEETSWSSKYFQCLLLVCPVEKVPACHSNTAS